jgi:hypothetical protein
MCRNTVREGKIRLRTAVLILLAPVVRDVKPNWHTKLFNGSFLHQNIYRQSAGPEVDAAWNALGVNCKSSSSTHNLVLTGALDRSIVVPEAEGERTGLRHDQVKVSQEYGGGFPANVEGLHHLHCLVSTEKTHLRVIADLNRIFFGRRCIGTTITTRRRRKAPL